MYKAEFRRPGSTGTMIAKADTLADLLRIVAGRGWRDNAIDVVYGNVIENEKPIEFYFEKEGADHA